MNKRDNEIIESCRQFLYSANVEVADNAIQAVVNYTNTLLSQYNTIVICGTQRFIGSIANNLHEQGYNVLFIDRVTEEGLFWGCPIVSLDDIQQEEKNNKILFVIASRSGVAFYNKVLNYYCDKPTILSFENLLLTFPQLSNPNERKDYTYAGVKKTIEDVYTNARQYLELMNTLKDTESKALLSRILLFRTTFDVSLNENVKSSYPDYLDKSVYQLKENESIVDLGGFTGDSLYDFVLAFRKMGIEKKFEYHFFEPVFENIQSAKLYFPMKNIFYYQCAVSSKKGLGRVTNSNTLMCTTEKLVNNAANEDTDAIRITTLDDCFYNKGKQVTLIKMDIEGEELAALMGAEKTITSYMPKLAICLYHKYRDILEIYNYVKSLNLPYDYYIRAHRNSLATEYILYAIRGEK